MIVLPWWNPTWKYGTVRYDLVSWRWKHSSKCAWQLRPQHTGTYRGQWHAEVMGTYIVIFRCTWHMFVNAGNQLPMKNRWVRPLMVNARPVAKKCIVYRNTVHKLLHRYRITVHNDNIDKVAWGSTISLIYFLISTCLGFERPRWSWKDLWIRYTHDIHSGG